MQPAIRSNTATILQY